MKNSFDILSKMSTFFSDINDTMKKCMALFNEPDLSDNDLSDNIKNTSAPGQCTEPGRFGILSTLYAKYPKTMFTIFVLHILISVCALVLSWECNRMTNFILRIVSTVIATIFSEVYIIYYAIYHIIMGFKCYVDIVPSSTVSSVSKVLSLPPL